jgi:hypothetical protein
MATTIWISYDYPRTRHIGSAGTSRLRGSGTFVNHMSFLTLTSDSETRARLEKLGVKFTPGGAHISRTMMLSELTALLSSVPVGAPSAAYREAVVENNVLGKTTDSTRKKSLRHLKEMYGLEEKIPLFRALRRFAEIDPASLPLLAMQVAWSRDTLLRATSAAVLDAQEGDIVSPSMLSAEVENEFPKHYSELNCNKIARNACSSWMQSGHLDGRTKKVRRMVQPMPVAATLAFVLGTVAGFHGSTVFSSPWIRLLDLNPDRARALALEAHRGNLLTLRAIGDVVELHFPMFSDLISPSE